jgi:hypothetical protein
MHQGSSPDNSSHQLKNLNEMPQIFDDELMGEPLTTSRKIPVSK